MMQCFSWKKKKKEKINWLRQKIATQMARCVYNNPLQDAFCFVYVKQVRK